MLREEKGKRNNRDYSGIIRLSTEEYISKLHVREQKILRLCQTLRDQVEHLEVKLADADQKLISAHEKKDKAVHEVRTFWRNAVLEEGSRGGIMLMAALRKM